MPVVEAPPGRPAAPAPDTPPPTRPRRVTPARRLAALTAAGAALAAGWVAAVLVTAGHGFDITDESFYLLSYRWWWRTGQPLFTGVQYLYGPVFALLGHDIAALRVFRLATVVLAHAAFAAAFLSWLRTRRPQAPDTRWWEAAGAAAIVAAGAAVYGWLPLSAGYNDVAILGCFTTMAVVLRVATHVDRGRPVPAWLPAALGPVAAAMLLAKWSTAVVAVVAYGLLLAVLVAAQGRRAVARVAGWAAAGLAGTLLVVHVALVPLTDLVPNLVRTNRLVAQGPNAPGTLLEHYLVTAGRTLAAAPRLYWPLLLGVALACLARGRRAGWAAGAAAAVGFAVFGWRAVAGGALVGGTGNLRQYVPALVALVAAVVIAAALRPRRPGGGTPAAAGRRWRPLLVYGGVLTLPVVQAAGTGNALFTSASSAAAAWTALAVALATAVTAAPAVTRWCVGTLTCCAVLAPVAVGVTGVWWHPYNTAPYARSTARAAGVAPLSSVRLDPDTAAGFADLRRRLDPYVARPGRAVMSFYSKPGLVLLLDGRSPGENWYPATDKSRAARMIARECVGRLPWWGGRHPVLIFDRRVTAVEIRALRACGLDFAADYRLLAPKEETMNFSVYVPVAPRPAAAR